MTRVVGWMRKYIQRYTMKLPVEADLDVEDVIQAEMAVVRMIQGRHFKIEGREIGKVSRQLSSLDPYTDSSGVLCVGGRLTLFKLGFSMYVRWLGGGKTTPPV